MLNESHNLYIILAWITRLRPGFKKFKWKFNNVSPPPPIQSKENIKKKIQNPSNPRSAPIIFFLSLKKLKINIKINKKNWAKVDLFATFGTDRSSRFTIRMRHTYRQRLQLYIDLDLFIIYIHISPGCVMKGSISGIILAVH